MIKFILSSFLFFLFLGIVSSRNLKIVTGDNDFTTTTDLRGIYSQQNFKDSNEGFHKAEVYFKTKIPSFNPDQSGVNRVNCERGNDGINKLTFSLKDDKAIKTVNKWPEKVMLLISHKWECFDKKTTQFFMVNNRMINKKNKTVTFTSEDCNVQDWANDYSIDLGWVEGKKNSTSTREKKKLDKRFNIGKAIKKAAKAVGRVAEKVVDKVVDTAEKVVDKVGDVIDKVAIPFPTIKPSTKLNLDINRRGRRAKKKLTIINNRELELDCVNCFVTGDATLSARIAGKIVPPRLDEASITLTGRFLLNLDFALTATLETSISTKDINLLNVPLGPINIPGIFNLGPSIDLIGSANVDASVNGIVEFGADLSLPNFRAQASFNGIPKFEQSGFKPQVNVHTPKGDIEASISVGTSLRPQLGFGVSILSGRLLDARLGFEIEGSLENSLTFGRQNECRSRFQPRLKSELGGNLGFFLGQDRFPIVEFPDVTLINRCLF